MPIRFFSHKAESQGHHEIRKSLRPTRASSDRAFGFTIGGILALVGLLPVISLHPPYWLLWLPATVLIIMAWLAPLKLAPLNRMWTRLGLLLQHIVSPLIMAMIFFLIVTPTGVLMRLTGKNPLHLHRKAKSHWIIRDINSDPPTSMHHQF